MQPPIAFLITTVLVIGAVEASTGMLDYHSISVNASIVTGTLKNHQGTNNAKVPTSNDESDSINDATAAVQTHWRNSSVKNVMIYTFPDVFTGDYTDGDAYDADNYNFTLADERVQYVIDGGATASAQFQEAADFTLFSAEFLEGIGYMITERYVNGATNSGFTDAIELWDFYPEEDKLYDATIDSDYAASLIAYTAFSKGVARASNSTGCGAWGFKRLWTPSANYTLPDPWKESFFADLAANRTPIKAATFHWDATMFSWDPYEIVTATKQFRELYLTPNGFEDLPIWITEHNRNPLGILPTTESALAAYNDPASFASWVIAVAMYGQDADAERVMSWTGLGYGGYGWGNAYFQAWYNQTDSGDIALNAGSAWVLSGDFVTNTPNRLAVVGSSDNGFTALAGISSDEKEVQVLLNNYQVDYDIVKVESPKCGFAFILTLYTQVPTLETSTSTDPIYQENGLFNGEQACIIFYDDLACTTFTQATIRDNTATAYKLNIENLPWSSSTNYTAKIKRVGGDSILETYKIVAGTGTSLSKTMPLPTAREKPSIRTK
ncbi:unnamed protein product [Penicillium glandicola]